jgi:hypothetical protein
MTRGPKRSRRSYVVEYTLAAIAVVIIWVFLASGGAASIGALFRP